MTAFIIAAMLAATSSPHAGVWHGWVKESSFIVQDRFGQDVLRCEWRCRSLDHDEHWTVTQGLSTAYCPAPRSY